jgi:UDP-N-acetyl-D-glucosamine dehydrogenase
MWACLWPLLYTEQKFSVTGFDIDARKVSILDQGGSYIFRIPATDIQVAKDGGFSATADYSRLTEMDAIIICVPTPLIEIARCSIMVVPACLPEGRPL